MKRGLSQKAKIIGSIGLISFSSIALITSTICWFVATRHNDVNGSLLVTNPENFDLSLKSYKFDDDLKIGYESSSDEMFSLQPYDTFIASRNKNLSIIFEVTLDSNENSSAGGNLNVSIPVITDYTTRDGTKVSNNVSNVIRFRMCRYSTTFTNNTEYDFAMNTSADGYTYISDADKKYNEVRKYMDSSSVQFSSYVLEDSLNENDLSSVSKNKNLSFNNNVVIPDDYLYCTVFIEVDYSPVLADFYYRHSDYSSGSTSLVGNKTLLNSDIYRIGFSIDGVSD